MAKVEFNRTAPIGMPGIVGTRPDIEQVICGSCPALFNRIVESRKQHADAGEFHIGCVPHMGEGTSTMTATVVYSENGSEVITKEVHCGVATPRR